MAQKFDARQTVSRDVLANLLGVSGTELDDLLRALNKEINAPLRLFASSPADSKINFQASQIEAADLAAKNASPVSSQIPSVPASTIDFQTGATTGGTINISFPNSTVGFFRRVGFSLDASGTIQAIFSAEAASLGALANAGTVFVKGALPLGWIDLEATAASPGRFKTAGSVSNIIENKVGSTNTVHRIIGGGGSGGSGSGSGVGDDINALTFKASFTDLFADLPSDALSAVDYSAGKTDATTYDIVNSYHRLAYDATRTVTGSGVNMTLSGAPAFTIKAGDMLVVGLEARQIVSLTSQTVFAVESAFTTTPSGAACTVSQAVHTKDLNNFAGDGLAISAAFSSSINQLLMTYEDTSAANDLIYDANTVPVIAYSASADGATFSSVNVRPTNLNDSQNLLNLPVAGTNMYLRLFANKASGSGFVNVLGYKVFFHRDITYLDGQIVNQSYARTDNSGTKINVTAIANVSGKTRIQLPWSFPVNVNAGLPVGALKVVLDGLELPRFVDGTVSISAFYKEIDQNTIELDTDYTTQSLELMIKQNTSVVDASDVNVTGIAQLQESASQGFQGFINTATRINATTTAGTPAPGTFFSQISNRKSLPDLTADLGVRMGVERVMTQSAFRVQDEFGPNGEIIQMSLDERVRFVGAGWTNLYDSSGSAPQTSTLNDWLEVTFYGTGLNILAGLYSAAADLRVSVDGGSEGSNIYVGTTYSGVLTARNVATNAILPAISGLPLGVHTVKIRWNAAVSVRVYGVEILNASSSLRVNPGSSYLSGKKATTIAQQTLAHNSSFETGTLGTRGGRVLVYQKADGSIAKAVQPTNSTTQSYSSADHTNEEIAKVMHFREFGAGRSDDFSQLGSTGSNRTFTLDDGTTTLVGSNCNVFTVGGVDTVTPITAGTDFITLTFVGTGLDIICATDTAVATTSVWTISVDGSSIGTFQPASGLAHKKQKIVSGLPYGTHTVRFAHTTLNSTRILLSSFIVYQPKKPTLPAGAVELADYNVMADYVANATGGLDTIGTGVLRKNARREITYVGSSWTYVGSPLTSYMNYDLIQSTTTGEYFQYTFYGTGFDFRFDLLTNNATAVTMTLDGSTNFSSYTTSAYGTGVSFVAATGVLNQGSVTNTSVGGLSVSGLTLGFHTIRGTYTSGGVGLRVAAIDVVTPIHSHKSNLIDLQNTLMVGSQSVCDNRKTSPLKDLVNQPKAVATAIGQTSGPSTASTAPIPCPDLSTTIKVSGNRIRVSYAVAMNSNTLSAAQNTQVYVDGVPVGTVRSTGHASSGTLLNTDVINVPVSPGIHKVDVYWYVGSGTTSSPGTNRSLLVEEV